MELTKKTRNILYVVIATLFVALLVIGIYGSTYAATPDHLRNPAYEHYHFRTQIIVDGEPVDFSMEEYQSEYDKNSCSAEVGGHPVDFHDNVDQMTHIHWNGVTGGEFLKYYGWNNIGGIDESLGKRYDTGLLSPTDISIYGNLLPEVSEDSNYYTYIGEENNYIKKDWNEFLSSDLEEFFGQESSIDNSVTSFNIFDWFSPKASAHGNEVKSDHEESDLSEEELSRINNLIGNVVIFVQNEEPSSQEINDKFSELVPLHESTCGG
jgi:hypothetical protein